MWRTIWAILLALNYVLSPVVSAPVVPSSASPCAATTRQIAKIDALQAYVEHTNPRIAGQSVTRALYDAATQSDIDVYLFFALAEVESTFDPAAVGREGETGLLQLHPRWHPQPDCIDEHCLLAGQYLRQLLDRGQSLEWAISAYNRGPSRADPRSLYVQRVLRALYRIQEWCG